MNHTFNIPMTREEFTVGIARLAREGVLNTTTQPPQIQYKGVTLTLQYDNSAVCIFTITKTPFFATVSFVESQIREYISRLRQTT